jgi:hypothetical protein
MQGTRSITEMALVSVLFLGCGGGQGGPDVDGAFRRIQVHEATIANRASALDECEAGAACPAADETCAAAEAICAIAVEIDDVDAHARCEAAERRCPRGP